MATKELYELYISLTRNSAMIALLQSVIKTVDPIFQQVTPTLLQTVSQLKRAEEMDVLAPKVINDVKDSMSPDRFSKMILEMIACKNVENVDYYISKMLKKVFTLRPETLIASDQPLSMSEILECSNIEEVILRAAEKKVQTLGYKGLAEIIKHLNKRPGLGLGFDEKNPEFIEACEMFEARNIIVHNAGIVNQKYLQNTKREDLKVGDIYPITEAYVVKGIINLMRFCSALDEQFELKFKLNASYLLDLSTQM